MAIDKEMQEEILRSISLTGSANDRDGGISVELGSRKQADDLFISRAGGLPRLKEYHAKQFQMVLNQPVSVRILPALAIRCCLCGEVINYPAWHRVIRYAINQFHFFIHFDSSSPTKPTAKCYRRE